MLVFPLNRPKPQRPIEPISPFAKRVLTVEQKNDCFFCQGCDVEMIDDDPHYVHPQTREVFCCIECAENN